MESATAAVEKLIELYDASRTLAVETMESGNYADYTDVVYPKIVVDVHEWHPVDRTLPYGYVEAPGRYSAAVTRPAMMREYLEEQLSTLCSNYPTTIYVGKSDIRIPPEYISGLGDVSEARRAGEGAEAIPRPTLDDVHDAIVDGEWEAFHGDELPLMHFGPQRVDIACARLRHYTGIDADSCQKYILFTNYDMHTTEFVRYGLERLEDPHSRYTSLITPAGEISHGYANVSAADLSASSGYQMPRFDLVTPEGDGITMINIGVGPSNAKTITDALAVLRPEAWIMIGHCAGLDGRMRIGDLILGNAYERRDHILDERVGHNIPIPAVPEVQRALEASVSELYGDHKAAMRTGTVISTDDRNWEWHTPQKLWEWLRGSTAVAVDMESCALAANGYRYRVPYGTLLAVSDLPLHAVPKLPAQAQAFYQNSKQAHMMCAVIAMEQLAKAPEKLHTRKLRRARGEVPFR